MIYVYVNIITFVLYNVWEKSRIHNVRPESLCFQNYLTCAVCFRTKIVCAFDMNKM
jgi:hypothetical protein